MFYRHVESKPETMKKEMLMLAVLVIFGFTACEKQMIDDDLQVESLNPVSGNELKSAHSESGNQPGLLNYTAHLSGEAEVPSNDSRATGQAFFKLNKDGDALSYTLIVAHIENVRMAHIHLAPAGENGPVTAWLYPSGPPAQLIPGFYNGILQKGMITSSDLVGPLAGRDLSDLLDMLQNGGAYVNVHTNQYPGGEIRGQVSGNGFTR